MSLAANWQSLVASAVVAALTTLLIEFTAKPYLEARKDKIVRRARDRDESLRALVAIQNNGQFLATRVSVDEMYDKPDALHEYIVDLRKLMATSQLAYAHLPRTMRTLLNYDLAYTEGLISAVNLTRQTFRHRTDQTDNEVRTIGQNLVREMIHKLRSFGKFPLGYLLTPRRRWIKRIIIRIDARSELKRRDSELDRNSGLDENN
jgi:hypothetical protein